MTSLEKLTEELADWWRRTGWGEAARSFQSDQLEVRANALTYRTLLSLVPLLAVSLSLRAGGPRP